MTRRIVNAIVDTIITPAAAAEAFLSTEASLAAGAAEVAALMGMGAFGAPYVVPKSRKSRGWFAAPAGAVVTEIAPNPKRAGSKEFVKFGRITVGMTIAQLRAISYNSHDLEFETGKGYLTLAVVN